MSYFDKFFTPFLGHVNSIPVNNWKKIFENNKISDYIPYSSYDEDTQLFHNNDDSISFSIEILTPHTRGGADTAGTMTELFEKMPENVYLSVMYYGSKNIKHLLTRYRNAGFETYLLEQPSNLPMSNRREDILIIKNFGANFKKKPITQFKHKKSDPLRIASLSRLKGS